jgi:transketolase
MTFPTAAAPPRIGHADLPELLTLLRSDAKHDPSAASTVDLHRVLYDRVLNVSP